MKHPSLALIAGAFGLVVAQALTAAVAKPQLPQHTVDISVPKVTGKSTTVKAGADLQAAINAAKPGDELVLTAGATWTGNYTLPNKGANSGWITIRSSNMSKLPATTQRVSPSNATNMPKIVAAGSGSAFFIGAHANHYRLMGLEITEQPRTPINYGLILEGDPSDVNASDLPSYITVDRCYLHGQVLGHIKFGMQMNGSYLAIVNSYVSEFHGIGQDTQAVFGYMGTGPLAIENNFLEASGENTLFGGAYDAIPNTTTADVTFTNNYVYKPQIWMTQSIVPPPSKVSVSASTGGSLTAGTYYYAVIAQGTAGVLSEASSCQSSRSAEVSVPISAAQGTATINWTPVSYGDAQDTRLPDTYIIARTEDAPGSTTRQWMYFESTVTGSFTDNGEVAPANNFSEWARFWEVKNLFEIKNGVRWRVDSNLFDGNWVQAQNGYAIVLTPRMESPTMQGNHISDITFSNNVVRHVAGGINISSEDDGRPSTDWPFQQATARLAFLDNLFEDVNWYYGGNGNFMELEAGSEASLPGAQDITMDHNTVFQLGNFATVSSGPALNNFSFTNNVFGEGTYGWIVSGTGQSLAAIEGAIQNLGFTGNVWAGDPVGNQISGNYYPSTMSAIGFVNYNNGNGGDYHLAASSPYKAKSGADPGANLDTLHATRSIALTGNLKAMANTTTTTTTPPTPVNNLWFEVAVLNSGKCMTVQADGSIAQFTCDATNENQKFSVTKATNGYEFFTQTKAGSGLNVWNSGTTDGNQIGLYQLTGASNEVFTMKADAAGHFTLSPLSSPKSCWDVKNNAITDGEVLQQWTCNGGQNESFSFILVDAQ